MPIHLITTYTYEFLAIPGYAHDDLQLLPSSISKQAVWRVYREAAESEGTIPVADTTFCYLWRTLVPTVVGDIFIAQENVKKLNVL